MPYVNDSVPSITALVYGHLSSPPCWCNTWAITLWKIVALSELTLKRYITKAKSLSWSLIHIASFAGIRYIFLASMFNGTGILNFWRKFFLTLLPLAQGSKFKFEFGSSCATRYNSGVKGLIYKFRQVKNRHNTMGTIVIHEVEVFTVDPSKFCSGFQTTSRGTNKSSCHYYFSWFLFYTTSRENEVPH